MTTNNLVQSYNGENNLFHTRVFALKNIDSINDLKCDYFPIIKDHGNSSIYRDRPSLSVSNPNNNYECILIIFGHGNHEDFIPSALDIGNLNVSYYRQEISNNKLFIESDLKAKDSDLSFIKEINLNLKHYPHLSPPHGIVNLLKGLDWFFPHFDSIDLIKFTNLIRSDHWFRTTNIDHYLEEIKSLEWSYRWSSRFKHGEGTIYNLHSILTPLNNMYLTHLIETISKIEIYHSDFANCYLGEMQVTEKEMAEVKFNHLNRSMILAFTNFIKSKYFLSLTRDYEKYPFKTLLIDT